MAAVTRRQYKGAAAPCTTTNSLTSVDTSVTLSATTGWPSTAAVPFYVVIDPGTSSEEKCSATISGSTLTLTRGQDDTTAVSHSSGATIYPVFSADDADEANALASVMTTRGDIIKMGTGPTVARLAIGSSGAVLYSDGTDPAWASLSTAGIAPVASPTFTGTPAAPTAANGTSTTQLATTAYVYANGSQQTVSTKTASYTLVAADRNTKVVMNSASATTITVNTSLFAAGDTLTLLNIGSGVCTITAGTATVSTAGSLALAQYGGGTLYFVSAGVSVFQADGVATVATPSGLTFLTGGTFTTASSVSLAANTFTATYRNYLLNINITSGVSHDGQALAWRGRAGGTDNTTANHSFALGGRRYSDGVATTGGNNVNQSSGRLSLLTSGNSNSVTATFFAPQLASRTSVVTNSTGRGVGDPDSVLQGGGFLDATTQFDSLSFYLASGTITGTYEVYGYAIA